MRISHIYSQHIIAVTNLDQSQIIISQNLTLQEMRLMSHSDSHNKNEINIIFIIYLCFYRLQLHETRSLISQNLFFRIRIPITYGLQIYFVILSDNSTRKTGFASSVSIYVCVF